MFFSALSEYDLRITESDQTRSIKEQSKQSKTEEIEKEHYAGVHMDKDLYYTVDASTIRFKYMFSPWSQR